MTVVRKLPVFAHVQTLFRKVNLNNFIGGLLLGALFSLVVNIATVQIQEAITKQKNLEALEREVMSHFTQSGSVIKIAEQQKAEGTPANAYGFTDRYDTMVWDTGNLLSYIYDLDPSVQSLVTTYYTNIVYTQNRALDHVEESINKLEAEYLECLFKNEFSCISLKSSLDTASEFYRNSRLNVADFIYKQSGEVMNQFHPTQNRLDDPFLRLVMGAKALEILKRPDTIQ